MNRSLIPCLAILLWLSSRASAQQVFSPKASSKAPVEIANHFLSLLNDSMRKQATYPFNSEERFDWHFVPRSRKGIALKSMTPKQREAAMAVLAMGLSEQGYAKASAIIHLEAILRELEGRGPRDTYRDSENYYFTIFGTPSPKAAWGWRIEGHHLALNFSAITDELVAVTPSFMGSNPATVPSGAEKGKQILKQEADLAFALLTSFGAEQTKKAVIATTAPSDIITGNSRKAQLDKPVGIAMGEMNESQKKIFRQLLEAYIHRHHKTFANTQMARIEKAGLENLYFAWAGTTDRSGGYYYRIQGPTLVIELTLLQR